MSPMSSAKINPLSQGSGLFKKNKALILAFVFCFVYWSYLICTADFVISCDAIDYERRGFMIYEKGWLEYFKTGPNREPIYPLLISVSMRIADSLSVSYKSIQILLQLFILFITQILTLIILRKLKINDLLNALVILYLGISPAIVNSAFGLYSEIAVYPFILGIIFFNHKFWRLLCSSENINKVCRAGFFLALCFLLATLTKGIFELITPIFIIISFIGSFILLRKNQLKRSVHLVVFVCVFLTTFYAPLTLYKYANKKYNGQFTLTDRGAWALYGQTARRMQPLNSKRLLSAVAFSVSWKFCSDHFSPQECQDWSFIASDNLGAAKQQELSKTLSGEKLNKKLMSLSIEKALSNPFQYVLLMGVESLKMFFWEAPVNQYVFYPQLVMKIYSLQPIQEYLSSILALMTLIGIIYLFYCCWKYRSENSETAGIFLSILILIVLYVTAHSFFYILPRYIYSLVPLYLILTASLFNTVILKYVCKSSSRDSTPSQVH